MTLSLTEIERYYDRVRHFSQQEERVLNLVAWAREAREMLGKCRNALPPVMEFFSTPRSGDKLEWRAWAEIESLLSSLEA